MNKKAEFDETILIRYLEHYLPGKPGDERVIYKTTQQIQDELADMVEMGINDIARHLHELGYEVGLSPDNRPAWVLMEH